MKLLLPFLLLCCSYLLPAQSFENLNFEQALPDSLTQTQAWKSRKDISAHTVRQAYEGQYAMQIEGQYSPQAPGFFYQQLPFQPKGLTHLRVSAFIRTENVQEGAAGLYAYAKQGEDFISYEAPINIEGSNDWQQHSLDIWLDERATHFRIGGQLSGNGKAWFDSFSIEVLPLSNAPLSEEAEAYLDSFFSLVKRHSLYRDSLDLTTMAVNAHHMAAGAQTPSDCYSTLRFLIDQIDHHSFLLPPERAQSWKTTSSDAKAPNFEMTSGHLIDGHYGYLSMPHCGTGDKVSLVQFADSLHNLLEQLDHDQIKGWVLDLRKNGGGNCWPMLSGIGPLLGEGICGHFLYTEGDSFWFYKDGSSGMDGYPIVTVSREPYELLQSIPPVAVLTGDQTASSGEVVAAAFVNRARTRSFGQATAGYCTGNASYELPDGALLFLAGSVYADRYRNRFDDKIHPDEIIELSANEEEDPVLRAALEWLKTVER